MRTAAAPSCVAETRFDVAIALQIACGEGAAAAIDTTGQLFTWGKNLNTGMLGHDNALYGVGTRLPTRVNALRHAKVASVSLGSRHAAAVTALK